MVCGAGHAAPGSTGCIAARCCPRPALFRSLDSDAPRPHRSGAAAVDLERSSDPTTLEADLPLTSVHRATDPDQRVHISSTELAPTRRYVGRDMEHAELGIDPTTARRDGVVARGHRPRQEPEPPVVRRRPADTRPDPEVGT